MEITGVGVVSAAGWGFPSLVAAIQRGVTCIRPVSAFSTEALRSGVGGEVPNVDPGMSAGDRVRAFARAALLEAVSTARLADAAVDPSRIALVAGTTQGTGWRDGPPPLGFLSDPFLELASEFQIGGPCVVVSTACTASANAIALGYDLLDDEEVDIAIVGGADALCLATYAGFNSMRSLDNRPCAPYTRSSGLTIGEGSGFLVLERPGTAASRGCTPFAEVLGHGSSADCYHPTAPDPSGRAAARAMVHALGAAGLPPEAVGYVNGHGTGTLANDAMELRAMELVFRGRPDSVPLSSIKSMIGHTLGSAGVIEVAACIASLGGAPLPPNVQADVGPTPSSIGAHGGALRLVATGDRHQPVSVAMSVNFGFGGTNTAMVLARPRCTHKRRRDDDPAIVISGLGAFGALGNGIDSWADAIWSSARQLDQGNGHAFDPEVPDLEHMARRHWRRMDRFSRLCLAAATGALADAGLPVDGDTASRLLVIATESGPADTIAQFNRSVGNEIRGANPSVFMNCSPNAAAGYLGAILHADGGGYTLPGGGIGTAVAVATAAGRLRRGAADLAIVVAADHLSPELVAAAEEAGLPLASPMPFGAGDGTMLGGAAVAMVLERRVHAFERGATSYCEIGPWGAVRPPSGDLRRGFFEAMSAATTRRALTTPRVDYLIAAASGLAAADEAEAAAIGERFPDPPLVGSTTHLTGTCLSASAGINIATAAVALRDRGAAPFATSAPRYALSFVGPVGGQRVDRVLVNTTGRGGSCASITLGRLGQ